MRKLKPIEFYFEFASPYGYFASVTVDGIAEKHGRTVLWRPIMLGVALNATGSKPNVLVPMKGEYFKRDIARCAKVINLPFSLPKKMPMNSLSASRAFYWLNEQDPRKAKELAAAIYYEHWGLGNDMSDLDDVVRVAEAIEIDGEQLKAGCQSQLIKDKLRDITMASVEVGVFGSPFIIADDEQFWGHDRLNLLDQWLDAGHW